MNILGVSALYHDSAACLVRDGEIIAAAQEERFTRRKHDAGFPVHAIEYCLQAGGLDNGSELDLVAFYEKPFLKCDRLFSTYLACAPRGARSFVKAVPVWIKQKLWIKETLRDKLQFEGPIIFPEHHESHAASAFFPSPYDEAAILTIDGVGEWATTTIGRGRGNQIELELEARFPHSLGLLYSAFTYYLGFRVNSGEYKVMGLAPYGEPRFEEIIRRELLDLREDGSFRLNLKHFDFMAGLTMINRSFERLFDTPRRAPEAELTQTHMDLARSLQGVTSEAMLRMARHAHTLTGARHLCLAGGVALNCVGNGEILREGPFDDIWIQPAAGDAGGALGAALLGWHQYRGEPRRASGTGRDTQKASLLGPSYDVARFLESRSIPRREFCEHELLSEVATLLAAGKVIGWFQGAMEFGPRALGNRSILADPRVPEMRETLNQKIKFRESFRPFAPAILRECVSDYVELDRASPYMLLVAAVKGAYVADRNDPARRTEFHEQLRAVRSPIPAVTHVDLSARVQTVAADENPRFHQLLEQFRARTGCGVLINTSFNVRGEPPVCTPEDAYRCFMRTGIDYLVLGDWLLDKRDQPAITESENGRRRDWLGDEYEQMDRSPRALRTFSIVIAAALGLLSLASWWKGNTTVAIALAGVAAVLVVLGFCAPMTLRPFHRRWTMLSLLLGWVMTRVILTLVFLFVVAPVGLLQRLFGKRPFEIAFRNAATTYWESRGAPRPAADYEKQF